MSFTRLSESDFFYSFMIVFLVVIFVICFIRFFCYLMFRENINLDDGDSILPISLTGVKK